MDDFDEAELEEAMERNEQIGRENDIKHSVWSMYEVTDFSAVPFPHAHTLFYENYFDEAKNINVPLNPNSTWLDLWRAADKTIETSGDADHIYIEFLNCDEDGIVELFAGS